MADGDLDLDGGDPISPGEIDANRGPPSPPLHDALNLGDDEKSGGFPILLIALAILSCCCCFIIVIVIAVHRRRKKGRNQRSLEWLKSVSLKQIQAHARC